MQKIELIPNIHSSILGFGCAPIMGAVDSKKAKRAVDCALDCGINHFDLARSYGYGDAEKFIGTLLAKKRNEVILASKFGIQANNKARLLKPVKPLVRWAMQFRKQKETKQHGDQNNVADRFLERVPLTAIEMRSNIEKSLKALKTDYLDYFFIHEPLGTLKYFEELKAVSEALKKEGKIRAWGLAFMQNQAHFHTNYINEFDLLQFNNSPGINGYSDLIKNRSNSPNIFFSPINGGNRSLSVSEKLLTLAADFNKSIILCSMFNEKHLQANAALFNL